MSEQLDKVREAGVLAGEMLESRSPEAFQKRWFDLARSYRGGAYKTYLAAPATSEREHNAHLVFVFWDAVIQYLATRVDDD